MRAIFPCLISQRKKWCKELASAISSQEAAEAISILAELDQTETLKGFPNSLIIDRYYGDTILTAAIRHGLPAVVNEVLERGALACVKNSQQVTPLAVALFNYDNENGLVILQRLLQSEEATAYGGRITLDMAIRIMNRLDDYDTSELLVEIFNTSSAFQLRATFLAALMSDRQDLLNRRLLEKGCDPLGFTNSLAEGKALVRQAENIAGIARQPERPTIPVNMLVDYVRGANKEFILIQAAEDISVLEQHHKDRKAQQEVWKCKQLIGQLGHVTNTTDGTKTPITPNISLLHMSRMCIRKAMIGNVLWGTDQLNIPNTLKEFIKLDGHLSMDNCKMAHQSHAKVNAAPEHFFMKE